MTSFGVDYDLNECSPKRGPKTFNDMRTKNDELIAKRDEGKKSNEINEGGIKETFLSV